MPGKILRRCTICKKFHASYLVEYPQLGKHYLCYGCWRNRSLATNEQGANRSEETLEVEPINSENMKRSAAQQAAHKRVKIGEA